MTENLYPKRREKIRVTDQRSGDETIHIVVDEETGQYYRFGELEFSIFWSLDGETSLEKIKEIIEEKFEAEIPLEQLQKFVEDLKAKELLEGVERTVRKISIWQNLFYLRKKVLDPKRLLDSLVNPLSFTFKPGFVIPGILLILWSLFYSFGQRAFWLGEAKDLFHGWGLLVLYVSLITIGFVHETGHALMCRYYGGRVSEIGVILIYFMPGFYANVSDAYLFRDKWQRAAVGAAGLFYQFVFSALAIIILTFTIPGSLLANFIIGMVTMSGFTALWNFNPLIKLDGYYVLSDILEVTNLRGNSFKYIGLLLQKWFLDLPDAKTQLEAIPPRLKRIYLWYGAFGFLYTWFFLWIGIWFLVKFVIRKLAGFGLVLLTGGIVWGAWNWYKHAKSGFEKFAAHIKENRDVRMIAASRLRHVGIFAAVLAILLIIPTRWGIKGACEVHPAVKRALAPLETGVITRVMVQAGEPIAKDQPFAFLDDFAISRELDALRIEKQLREERLAQLKAEYGSAFAAAEGSFHQSKLALEAQSLLSPHKLQEAKSAMQASGARYEKAKTNLGIAKSERDRFAALAKDELVSPKEMEEKQSAFESAEAEYQAARDDYAAASSAYARTLKEATVTEPRKLQQDFTLSRENLKFTRDKSIEINAAQSELNGVISRIQTDEKKMDRMVIRSPINGVVMTPRVKELEGKLVSQGQQIAWVYEPGPMIFEIRTDELNISEVPRPEASANKVSFKILAIPGKSFQGKVTRIVPEGMMTGVAGKAFLVDVSVNDPEGRLLPGMQGTAKIYGRWHPMLWQIIRRPVKYIAWKLWSLF